MANKNPMTHAEYQEKLERKAEKRKIFSDTFFKALASMLSVVFVYAMLLIGYGM